MTPTDAPADPRAPGEWTFHRTSWNQMGTTCASPDAPARPPAPSEYGYMCVPDMNGDKRPDILTTMGHSGGVLWLAQAGVGNWTRHVIDDAWSAAHASTLADIDGARRLDFVNGKRAQIHSDATAAERDHLGVYWYALPNGSSQAATRHVIDEAGSMGGGGLQIVAVDIDGDGDLDVIASGKTGLYLAEHVRSAGLEPASHH